MLDGFESWEDWRKRQESALPRRIRDMHSQYGETEGRTCNTCVHCLRFYYARAFYKCDLSRMTGGKATDWRVAWPACGRWEAK